MKESTVRGERVVIPEFEIVSNPVVRIDNVKQQRFHIIDRAFRGWYVNEVIGIGIVNPRGIATATLAPIDPRFTKEDLSPEEQFFEEV